MTCRHAVYCGNPTVEHESYDCFISTRTPTTVLVDLSHRDLLADERADILARFTAELAKATGDGSKKRRAGTKPPWYADDSHEAAVFSHLMKWKRGELVDPDSGAHPLVHAAWRCLAIALRESSNVPD